MAFPRVVERARRGPAVHALRRRRAEPELHVRRRRRRGEHPGDGARRAGDDVQRRRRRGGDDERDDRRCSSGSPAGRWTSAASRPSPATSGARRPTRRGSRSDLGWSPRTPLEEGLRAQWEWAAVESRAMNRPQPSRISTPSRRSTSARSGSGSRRAGGCRCSGSLLGLARRLRARSRRRQGLRGRDARRDGPAVLANGGAPVASFLTNGRARRGDHPLRVGAREGRAARRAARRARCAAT